MSTVRDVPARHPIDRAWTQEAVRRLMADGRRSADTHLRRLALPADWEVEVYLKDESTHPTGSLKHRLARSLFLYAICNGWIGPGTTVTEASSGSTAISEAHIARLLGLPFVAVMASSTSPEKIALIEAEGGRPHLIDDPSQVYDEARRIAVEAGGHYMDQFTYAERATDWRGNNNIAESIFDQLQLETHPVPEWIVVGAGTGGTSATIGRYTRYQGLNTRLCVVDPENSAFLRAFAGESVQQARGSRIEGIGRPRVEPSFNPAVVDRMLGVPDAGSIAGMQILAERTGIQAGASTGTNLFGTLLLACEMRAAGRRGSIVTLVCDHAERYRRTAGDEAWVSGHRLQVQPHRDRLRTAWDTGVWDATW
ncbi:PLP-dependent cysteine synthase family protein [Dermacoccaceae bacterium W4C1]